MPTPAFEPELKPRRDGPRVLIVRPSALGDVARTVPCLVTLRSAMPTAHIDWLVQDTFADVIRHHPMLDGIVAFPRKAFKGLAGLKVFGWTKTLRRNQYDIAIDLQGLFRSGWLTRRSGAKQRIGFANARELGWVFYNRRHHVDANMHTVDRMLALLAAEGHAISHDMRLYTSAAEEQWLNDQLATLAPPRDPQRFIVLAPTARWLCKCWPLENFTALARRILDANLTNHLIILASPAEREQVQPLLDALKISHPGAAVSLPTTTIGQMMAILRSAALVVCNDSGPLHIAVGFDRPIVAIFGPTDPALVGPYHRDETVVRPSDAVNVNTLGYYRKHPDDQSLIAKVPVDAVWERVIEQRERFVSG